MSELQKTKKRWVNSADIILILAVAAIVCGAVFRRPVESMIADRFSAIGVRYTLSVSVTEERNDFLKEGDRLFNPDGENIGTIEAVIADPLLGNVTLTVVSDGLYDSSGLYVGTEEPMFIAPGKTLEAHSSDYTSFSGIVKSAEKIKE